MLHSEAVHTLGILATKLEIEMRFKEREAVEYAISKLTETAVKDSMALAQAIFESAQQASDMYNKGLI